MPQTTISGILITCIINPGAIVVRSCCKASLRFSSIWSDWGEEKKKKVTKTPTRQLAVNTYRIRWNGSDFLFLESKYKCKFDVEVLGWEKPSLTPRHVAISLSTSSRTDQYQTLGTGYRNMAGMKWNSFWFPITCSLESFWARSNIFYDKESVL